VQCDQQYDARNQDNKRDKKMAVRENGFRSLGKSQWNLQGQLSLRLPNVEAKPYIPMCAISMQSSADDRWEVACSGACWRGAIIRAMM
jgi:ribosome assembly protein YihI (activator of Der GTPase)